MNNETLKTSFWEEHDSWNNSIRKEEYERVFSYLNFHAWENVAVSKNRKNENKLHKSSAIKVFDKNFISESWPPQKAG